MRELEGQIHDIQKLLVLLNQVFLQIRDFLIEGMLVALVGLEGSGQLVHEVRAEEIEVLMQGLLRVNIDQLILLNDEEILGNEHLSNQFPPIRREVVQRDDDLGVLVEGGRIVDF